MLADLIAAGLKRIRGNEQLAEEPIAGQRHEGLRRPRTSLPVGHFSLVGLTEVRQQLGARWPDHAERVHALARSVISKHLLPGDVFEQHDEESYVVLFAQLGQKEAEFKCRAIGSQITQRLLGEDFGAGSRVWTVCAELPLHKADDNPEAALRSALKAARASGSDSTSLPITNGPRRRAANASEGASIGGSEVLSPGQPRTEQRLDKLDGRAIPSFKAHPITRTSAPWRYVPILDLKNRVVVHFRLAPEDNGRALECTTSLQTMFETDLWALKRATTDLGDLSRQGKRVSIVSPIHATSVGQPISRRAILRIIAGLPPDLRRLLTIQVMELDLMPARAHLDAFVASLKALDVGVTSRVPLDSRSPLGMYKAFSIVTAELPSEMGEEGVQIACMSDFASRAEARGMECGAAGLTSTSLVLGATAAGFRYLSGSAIQPQIESIGQAARFDLAQIYDR